VPATSFLFKKGNSDYSKTTKFFTIITSQLVHQLPLLAPHVRNTIKNDPTIINKNKGKQFQKLILEPLNKYKGHPHIPALISVVINTLNKYNREEDTVAIIRILSKAKKATFISLKFFITNKPKLPIYNNFSKIQNNY